MNLHKDRELFYDVINEIAYENKISASIIEKDYYVILFLKKLIELDNHFIFKGGNIFIKRI